MDFFHLDRSSIKNLPGRKMWMLMNLEEHDVQEMSACYIEVEPQKGALPFHAHKSEKEFIYILDGKGHIEYDGNRTEVGAGTGIFVDYNESHALFNDDDSSPLRALCVFVPPSTPEDYIDEKEIM
jgi:Mannose-6-phosphate isomerase